MIKLTDSKFEDKSFKVFNGGNAGIVEGCTYRVEKKTAQDADNAPDYKMFIVDANGGEMNEGFYAPSADSSDKAQEYFVKKMNYYMKEFRIPQLEEAESYKQILDYVMKGIRDTQDNGIKLNVAVAYGTEKRPSKFLTIDGYWGLKNVTSGKPTISSTAILTRPQPDQPEGNIGGSEDAGNDDW